jgi:radical SAM superfamily enzyme YgiQ (UPF0313 family)
MHSRALHSCFVFSDNNLYADPAYAKALFARLRDCKITWAGSASIDIAKDPELLSLAKQSGCKELLIGFETYPGSLESEKKGKYAFANEYVSLAKALRDAGIEHNAHFIFGFDGDRYRDAFTMFLFSLKLRPVFATMLLLMPLPGTAHYGKMLAADRVLTLDWRQFDGRNLVLMPTHMHPYAARATYWVAFLLMLVNNRIVACVCLVSAAVYVAVLLCVRF